MKSQAAAPALFWQSCGEPSASWFLVWMPLVLVAFGGDPSLTSAMVRLLAVLLVAGLIWARGRGPIGVWPERLFISAWAATWAAALGTLATSTGWPRSLLGTSVLVTALVVGAGWLGFACQLRHDLHTTRKSDPQTGQTAETHASYLTVGLVWILTALLLALAVLWRNAHWGDAIVLVCALAGFTAFQTNDLERRAETAH